MEQRAEILAILSEKSKRLGSLTQADKEYIKKVHSIVLRREFIKTNCSDCYGDALILMLNHLKCNNIMSKSNYQLKNGVVMQSATIAGAVTNANITDESAEKYLKENEKRLSFFAVFPNKWNKKAEEMGLIPKQEKTQKPENEGEGEGENPEPKGNKSKKDKKPENKPENENEGEGESPENVENAE